MTSPTDPQQTRSNFKNKPYPRPITPPLAFTQRALLLWWEQRHAMLLRILIATAFIVPARWGLESLFTTQAWRGLPLLIIELFLWSGVMLLLLSPYLSRLPRGGLPLWRRWVDMFAYGLLYIFSFGLFTITVSQMAGIQPAEDLAGAALPLQMTDPGWLLSELLRHMSFAFYLAMTGALPVALARRYHLGLEDSLALATGRRVSLFLTLLCLLLILWQSTVLVELLRFLLTTTPRGPLAEQNAVQPPYDILHLAWLSFLEMILWSFIAAFLASAYASPLERAYLRRRRDISNKAP